MSVTEHPVEQEIDFIVIWQKPDNTESEVYQVGTDQVTRIEACTKSGLHANIPYVRVWRDDVCLGEWCQHNIIGVYFKVRS